MSDTCMIMMAAYNSERFLREQLDSIINQTHKNWRLIIQDDGSTDDTVNIIRDYMKQDDRITLKFNTDGRHGAFPNFHSLINKCKKEPLCDYYLFADHDDVWMPHKIERMLEKCHAMEKPGRPLMIYGDMKIIDAEGGVLAESLDEQMHISIAAEAPLMEFVVGAVRGCNTIFNRALFQIVPEVGMGHEILPVLSHDRYYAKFSVIKGDIGYIEEPLILYRRYDRNVSTLDYKYGIKKIIRRMASLKELPELHARDYNQALYAILRLREIELTDGEAERLDQLENALRCGGFRAVKFCVENGIICRPYIRTLSRYLILLSGTYKKYLIQM